MVQFECPRHPIFWVWPRLGEIHFPISSLPLSGVIRIGLPIIKEEKIESWGNKRGFISCKWSSLNAPSTKFPETLQLTKLKDSILFIRSFILSWDWMQCAPKWPLKIKSTRKMTKKRRDFQLSFFTDKTLFVCFPLGFPSFLVRGLTTSRRYDYYVTRDSGFEGKFANKQGWGVTELL